MYILAMAGLVFFTCGFFIALFVVLSNWFDK